MIGNTQLAGQVALNIQAMRTRRAMVALECLRGGMMKGGIVHYGASKGAVTFVPLAHAKLGNQGPLPLGIDQIDGRHTTQSRFS
jgi:hypothetical protein